jgi:anti-sigma B factor antagonist
MSSELVGRTIFLTPEFNHLDALNAQEFTDQYSAIVAGSTSVAINMTNVQFVDSSGLGAILNLVRDIHEQRGKIAIFGSQPSVKVLFRLVRLSNLVTILDSRDQAIAWAED